MECPSGLDFSARSGQSSLWRGLSLTGRRASDADLAAWAPAVDIYETEQELVVKADLPDMQEKEIDVRVENNTLSIRGERKFEKDVHQDKYLRVERAPMAPSHGPLPCPTPSTRRLSAPSIMEAS